VLENHSVELGTQGIYLLAGLLEEERREYFSIQFPENSI
jgi:hypothetical protein